MFVVEVEFFLLLLPFLNIYVVYLHIYVDMFFHIFIAFLIISFLSMINVANLINTCICKFQNNVFVMICK